MQPIKTGNHATVVNDKKLKGSGLRRGDEVYVISTKVLPEKRNDPYLQRSYVVVVKVNEEGGITLPSENNDENSYLIDPRNLALVSEERAVELREEIEKQYG